MATHPRHRLVDAERPPAYHVVSRNVQREWLPGRDRRTGQDHSHRKPRVSERALGLSSLFAVALDAFAVMGNHFHLVAARPKGQRAVAAGNGGAALYGGVSVPECRRRRGNGAPGGGDGDAS